MALTRRYLVWGLLAAPGAWLLAAWAAGATFYGEVVHGSGVLAARLLIVTLAITPVTRLLPRSPLVRWLRVQRRYLGVATFAYAALHAAVYLARQPDLAAVLDDAREVWMWTGWLALIVMLPLAATSHDAAVRWLRSRWRWLHRAVYPVAVLTFLHWILSAFDPGPAWIHAGLLVALESLRFWHARGGRGTRSA
jgi:sulfoxide reductase heme-binding subunit YedZ